MSAVIGAATLAALGGISAGSSALSGAINYGLQKDQQKFNAAEAQKSRDWQKMMSDTQYQRQVADMEAAGLNPAAIGSGSGGTSFGATEASSGISQGANIGMLGALAYNALRLMSESKKGKEAVVDSLVDSVRTNAIQAIEGPTVIDLSKTDENDMSGISDLWKDD